MPLRNHPVEELQRMVYLFILDRKLTDELLQEACKTLLSLNADPEKVEIVKKSIEANIGVLGQKGVGLSNEEVNQMRWLGDRLSSIRWFFFDRYVRWLRTEGFPSDVVSAISEDSEEILGCCGDPQREGPWFVRGLVMGDVQSGKTASYSALINRAADAGYKVIILLTGMIEELREQTQSRLDEAFIGYDSVARLAGATVPIGVGVGHQGPPPASVLTSRESDFLRANTNAVQGLPLAIAAQENPVLFVMKKNTAPLSGLIRWIGNQPCDLPMLLVDDEADNASVNTRDTGQTPAAINKLIRELLSKFTRRTYCAYTATPFANVFIDPDNFGDLFPENFIYALSAPSNYMGVTNVFSEEAPHEGILRTIEDDPEDPTGARAIFPPRHKRTLDVNTLPACLQRAIRCFLLSSTIRDLRKEKLKHRTMLVNVSLYNDVQKQVGELVSGYIHSIKEASRQYLSVDSLWVKHQLLLDLKATFDEEFDAAADWDSVRERFYDTISTVKTVVINQEETDEAERLNYKDYSEDRLGRRIVAVGGLTLSRGLTLEGLSTSYFYRHSPAYDTLLQMGRWFGYRPNYEDMCRVWMSGSAQDWYAHIAQAVEELRRDLNEMRIRGKKPIEFGIKVRSHRLGLVITARNKMRSSKEIVLFESYRGKVIETSILYHPNEQRAQSNLREIYKFLLGLQAPEMPSAVSRTAGSEPRGPRLWRNVPKLSIASLLKSLHIPSQPSFFPSLDGDDTPIVKYIADSTKSDLQAWDVALQQGDGDPVNEFSLSDHLGEFRPLRPVTRTFQKPVKSDGYTLLTVNKSRVGQPTDTTLGLDRSVVNEAKQYWECPDVSQGVKTPNAAYYCRFRQTPILNIYVIKAISAEQALEAYKSKQGSSKAGYDDRKRRYATAVEAGDGLFVAISLAFPSGRSESTEEGEDVGVWRINAVAQRNQKLPDAVLPDDFEI